MTAVQQLMLTPSRGSLFTYPYQMSFGPNSVDEYSAVGFNFPVGSSTSTVYDEESLIVPAGANVPPWTPVATAGHPPASAGHYLKVRTGSTRNVPSVLILPSGFNAKYVAGWYAFNSGGGINLSVIARYANGDSAVLVSGVNGLGYAPFQQFSTASPPYRPAFGTAPNSRISQLEFTNHSSNDWYFISLDDLTFYA